MDKQKHYDRYGEEDRTIRDRLHQHTDRGRPSFDLNNEEYDQRGGRNNDRGRDSYSIHSRSNAGDRYRNDDDDRFDEDNRYGSSRNYGGMGGFGGAQGFGTSRAGSSNQAREQDHGRGRYDATSGHGNRPGDRQSNHPEGQRQLYGAYRGPESYDSSERENSRTYGSGRERERYDHDAHQAEYARSGFANTGDSPDRHRNEDRISGGDFSPMLGGSGSRGWYTPEEGGYSRQGGYPSRGMDRGSHAPQYNYEDDDANYGLTFGDDIHYDPTSRDPRNTWVQDQERRSMAKYGSETREPGNNRDWDRDRDQHQNRRNR